MVEGHITAVAHNVAANAVTGAVCAGCVALGLSHTADLNDPHNWPIWLAAFGAVGFVGTGTNTARLWLTKRRIARASGDQLTIILAGLVGDDASHGQKANVRDALKHYLGSSIHLITYPEVLAIGDGHNDQELAKTHSRAQRILEDKRGDILIWGRVKAADALALYFTRRAGKTSDVSSYPLVSDAERALELPAKFDRDLGAAIAARVIAVGDALLGRQGTFLTPYAETFARQIAPLVAHPKANWPLDARGAVLHAFGLAKELVGRERGESASLEEAVAAFREALKERTRERVPLDWAATQNNLGIALGALGVRESGTARLEEAVAALREALKERTRERAPLDWAASQSNLGLALGALGDRESGTARLEESVAAHRETLQERYAESPVQRRRAVLGRNSSAYSTDSYMMASVLWMTRTTFRVACGSGKNRLSGTAALLLACGEVR